MQYDMELIGKRIKAARKAKRYTQEYVSTRANIGVKFLSQIECGKAGLSVQTLLSLCTILEVNPNYILLSDITGQTVLGDGALDMVLIDIEDQDAASHYHVNTLGVYVLAVDQGSEAYEAGVRSGDRIVSANGQPVTSTGEFGLLRAQLEPSAALEMVLERGQGEESLTVTLMGDAQTQEAGQEEGNGVDEG